MTQYDHNPEFSSQLHQILHPQNGMEANQHIFSPQRGTSGGSGGMTCNYVFPHSDLSLKPTELEYLVEIMLETETLKYVVDIYLLVYNLC